MRRGNLFSLRLLRRYTPRNDKGWKSMITIIHGSNQALTRNELQNLKAKFKEVVTINGKDLVLKTLQLSLESQSLFGYERLVVVENFFVGRKSRDDIISYLQTIAATTEIVFWEDKESKSKDLTKLASPYTKVAVYNLPIVIFKFLDSFYPGNVLICKQLFEDCLSTNEPEMIFFMLVKQLRYLQLAQTEAKNKESGEFPSDYARLAPWQKQKLFKQAELFTFEKLSKLYEDLMMMEYNLKTGQTNLAMEETLRIFLLENL